MLFARALSIAGRGGELAGSATVEHYDAPRQSAISLLSSPNVRQAFDVTKSDAKTQERYGANSFGWSLLMAYRLVEAGVRVATLHVVLQGAVRDAVHATVLVRDHPGCLRAQRPARDPPE